MEFLVSSILTYNYLFLLTMTEGVILLYSGLTDPNTSNIDLKSRLVSKDKVETQNVQNDGKSKPKNKFILLKGKKLNRMLIIFFGILVYLCHKYSTSSFLNKSLALLFINFSLMLKHKSLEYKGYLPKIEMSRRCSYIQFNMAMITLFLIISVYKSG